MTTAAPSWRAQIGQIRPGVLLVGMAVLEALVTPDEVLEVTSTETGHPRQTMRP